MKKILLFFAVLSLVFLGVLFLSFYSDFSKVTTIEKEYKTIIKLNDDIYEKAGLNNDIIKKFSKPLPMSLEGVDLNIRLPVDSKGNLIVGIILKDFFEIYLTAMGEEKLEDILLRIQSAMNQQLISPALEQGYDALKRYIDYKVELAKLEQQVPDSGLSELDNIRQQKEVLAAMQQNYFSMTETDAFFASEEQYDDFMLQHLTIQQDENLTLEEKQARTQSLAESLPTEVKRVREAAMAAAEVYEKALQMRSSGDSEEVIYQMRSKLLGDDAAHALAQLDYEREEWNQRLERFNAQYQAIQTSGMSTQDANSEIDALLGRDFTAIEVIRVKAISGL